MGAERCQAGERIALIRPQSLACAPHIPINRKNGAKSLTQTFVGTLSSNLNETSEWQQVVLVVCPV